MGQTDPSKAATSLVLRERDSELRSLQDEADELRKRIEVEKRRCGRYEEAARKVRCGHCRRAPVAPFRAAARPISVIFPHVGLIPRWRRPTWS